MVLSLLLAATAFTPPTSTSFATFGNAQTKSLIQSWQPKPLSVNGGGAVLTPASTENMKRFVRARILLEQDASLGCMAAMEDSLCVILCRFSKAEHQVCAAEGGMGDILRFLVINASACATPAPARATNLTHCARSTRASQPPQLVLPLWQPSASSSRVFEDLQSWHAERFGGAVDSPRLSGAKLESDKDVWEETKRKRE